jgi:hypothetical protein
MPPPSQELSLLEQQYLEEKEKKKTNPKDFSVARLRSLKKQMEQQRDFDSKKSTLQQKIDAAFEDDDWDQYEDLEEQMKALMATHPQQQGSASSLPVPPPVVTQVFFFSSFFFFHSVLVCDSLHSFCDPPF